MLKTSSGIFALFGFGAEKCLDGDRFEASVYIYVCVCMCV